MTTIRMNMDNYRTYSDEEYGEEVMSAGWIPQLAPEKERLSEHRVEPARAVFPLFAPAFLNIDDDEDFGDLLAESFPRCP
ncbi:MAG: hypothetical protein PHH36_09445 [Sideroxydans sp.]|nr:hypothetical protein [Sideroxydans sp.]